VFANFKRILWRPQHEHCALVPHERQVEVALPGSARFRVCPHVSVQAMPDGLVLLHLDRGTAFRLNATGQIIWDLAAQSQPLDAMVQRLSAAFPVSRGQLERDVAALLADLISHELLDPLEPAACR
jgi:Coenzyme PQQ synthesis protein D (PqqD)